jgi:hypothetical protein
MHVQRAACLLLPRRTLTPVCYIPCIYLLLLTATALPVGLSKFHAEGGVTVAAKTHPDAKMRAVSWMGKKNMQVKEIPRPMITDPVSAAMCCVCALLLA